ncbi:MAG: hypothetical protein AAGF90_10305 [Pseudomonadota bacterium]
MTATPIARVGDAVRAALLRFAESYWRARRAAALREMSDAELAIHFKTREEVGGRGAPRFMI